MIQDRSRKFAEIDVNVVLPEKTILFFQEIGRGDMI